MQTIAKIFVIFKMKCLQIKLRKKSMKKVLTFGASSSKKSINKQFAKFVSAQFENTEMTLIDLNDFEMPIFSVDREENNGIPQLAKDFKELINESDAILISLAEHNGSYSVAFKNILDWSSRIERNMWKEKPMFLTATSPGGRGASTVLNLATTYFPFLKANVVASFSLPSFYENFSIDEGIKNDELRTEFEKQLKIFGEAINK